MKNTVRVSYDVPVEEHTYLKMACVEAHIPFKELMRDVFHKTVEEYKKQKLHERLRESIQQSKEGKCRVISVEELDEMIGNE